MTTLLLLHHHHPPPTTYANQPHHGQPHTLPYDYQSISPPAPPPLYGYYSTPPHGYSPAAEPPYGYQPVGGYQQPRQSTGMRDTMIGKVSPGCAG